MYKNRQCQGQFSHSKSMSSDCGRKYPERSQAYTQAENPLGPKGFKSGTVLLWGKSPNPNRTIVPPTYKVATQAIQGMLTQSWDTKDRPPYLAPIGMTPLDPTPTGMWSNSDWANCSFTGWTSPSSRFVLSSRTPQLMSKPTPPAEQT